MIEVTTAPTSEPLTPVVSRTTRNVRFEALSCRRLAAPSCANPPPPNALQTILSDGRSLGEVVVMDIGYNDSASSYGSELDTAMRDMLAAGVHHVIWVTLRERYNNYHSTNEVIEAARHRWRRS
jgi:hypothetical protein